jgi:hypothetical protein
MSWFFSLNSGQFHLNTWISHSTYTLETFATAVKADSPVCMWFVLFELNSVLLTAVILDFSE